MRRISKLGLFALFIVSLTPSTAAMADGYLEITGFPESRIANTGVNGDASGLIGGSPDGQAIGNKSTVSYDVRSTLGYRFYNWWMLGASFNYIRNTISQDATDVIPSSKQTLTSSEWGVSGGYVGTHFRLVGTYLFTGKAKATDVTPNIDGTPNVDRVAEASLSKGFQVTLGYSFPLSSWFAVGPSLTYRRVWYDKQNYTDNTGTNPNYTDKPLNPEAVSGSLLPMISLIFFM